MYLHEPVYDPDELFRCNYHIHTSFSRCGKTEMRLKDIVEIAEKDGIKEIAITDHIHPGEELKLFRIMPILQRKREALNTDVKVILGAELSAYGINRFSLKTTDYPLEYRLYAHNHYHMFGWEQPKDRSPMGYKEHCKKTMENVIVSGKADCLAHPFCDRYIVREFEEEFGFTMNCITSLWTDNEIGDLLSLGKEHLVSWELNTAMLPLYPDFAKRYFHIGKEVGVCFNVGTDAHRLTDISTKEKIERFSELFGV